MCLCKFGNRRARIRHHQDHRIKGEFLFICETCRAGFQYSHQLVRHEIVAHDETRPYICRRQGCLKRFSVDKSRQKHRRLCHNKRTLKDCKSLEPEVEAEDQMENDVPDIDIDPLVIDESVTEQTNKINVTGPPEQSVVSKIFYCRTCNVPYGSHKDVVKHYHNYHRKTSSKIFPCPFPNCNKVYRATHSRLVHRKKMHFGQISPEEQIEVEMAERLERQSKEQINKQKREEMVKFFMDGYRAAKEEIALGEGAVQPRQQPGHVVHFPEELRQQPQESEHVREEFRTEIIIPHFPPVQEEPLDLSIIIQD